jgi:hypothetical protein
MVSHVHVHQWNGILNDFLVYTIFIMKISDKTYVRYTIVKEILNSLIYPVSCFISFIYTMYHMTINKKYAFPAILPVNFVAAKLLKDKLSSSLLQIKWPASSAQTRHSQSESNK